MLLAGISPGWDPVRPVLDDALKAGLTGVAMLSPDGAPLAVKGALDPREVRALAALVTRQGPTYLLEKLFAGELAMVNQPERVMILGIAARCVFVLAVAEPGFLAAERVVTSLLEDLEVVIYRVRSRSGGGDWIPPRGSGGSGSAPAEAFVFWPTTFRGRSGRN